MDSKDKVPVPPAAPRSEKTETVVIAHVQPTTNVRRLARLLADYGMAGRQVIMYPATPFH